MHRRTYERLRLTGRQADDQYVEDFRIDYVRFEKAYERLMSKVHQRS
jgi:hypothetical protein